jgi:hypothetical protein
MERKSSLVSGDIINNSRDIIVNRDPTLGASDLIGTTANVG